MSNLLIFIFAGGILLPILAALVPYRHRSKMHALTALYVGVGTIAYAWVTVASATALITG